MIITNCYNIALQNNKRNTVYLLMDIQFIHVKPQSWGRKNILQQNTDHVTCMTSLSENRFTMANMGMAWVNVWRKNRNALTASQRASNLLYSERSTIKQQSEYRFFFIRHAIVLLLTSLWCFRKLCPSGNPLEKNQFTKWVYCKLKRCCT